MTHISYTNCDKYNSNTANNTNNMTEREDKVYKAKLAEQAERYDGNYQAKLFKLCSDCVVL